MTITEEKIFDRAIAILSNSKGIVLDYSRDDESYRQDVNDKIVRDLLYKYFRFLPLIQYLTNIFIKNPPKKNVAYILELSFCQLLFQQGIEKYHLVDATVTYSKKRFNAYTANFVNAVLRNFNRKFSSAIDCNNSEDTLTAIYSLLEDSKIADDVLFNIPESLLKHLKKHFKRRVIKSLAATILIPTDIILRIRGNKDIDIPDGLITKIKSPVFCKTQDFYKVENPEEFFKSKHFKEGLFYICDPATVVAVNMLAPQKNEVIGDLCSAPGGKGLLIAEKTDDLAELILSDRSFKRLKKVQENLKDHKVTTIQADVQKSPFKEKTFDAILLDVPCSNTGVIRHKPDVKFRFSKNKLKKLVELQYNIAESAISLLKEGGRMVYSTCSILPEENSMLIEKLLSENKNITLLEELKIFPNISHDGAYSALLQKNRL
ncbi:MAG: RsmB/NOP family class I SAM-dependent RNA methyltransferase [Verrucomicrobiota bacterium]|nr:RsmB/NOP family class I SAM-dependent RNA methyltransferase [Verrucomicrobiota bacterium]